MKEIFVPLYKSPPHLEYAIQENCPFLKIDTNRLERIHKAVTGLVKGLKGLSYKARLRALKCRPSTKEA